MRILSVLDGYFIR